MRAYLVLLGVLVALPSGRAAPIGGTVKGHAIVVENGKKMDPPKDVPEYVYLVEDRPKPRKDRFGDEVVRAIDHRDRKFDPHVVVVPVGATMEFPNYDHLTHNAFSPSQRDPFDLKRYQYGARPTRRFFEPAELDMYCDIHKDMWAKIKVVDSAWIAEVKDGAFVLTDVPPGTYKVVAWWRDSLEVRSEPITVTAGETTTLRTELHVQAGQPKPHNRKDGSAYPPY